MSIKAWQTSSSRDIVKDRWLHLTADDCCDDRGQRISPFYVIHAAEWVSILALTDDDDVVLVKEYHHGCGLVLSGFPGGAVEPGEDLLTAALRELREETGYLCGDATMVGSAWANWGNHDNRVHFVVAQGCHLPAGATPAAGEEVEVVLRPLAEVIADPPEQAFHRALLWQARDFVLRRPA